MIKKPLRILIVANTNPDPDSGAGGTEVQTVQELRKLGNQVDTIWRNDLSHRIKHGNFHYLLELPFTYWSTIKRKIKHTQYDVIHINQPHGWYAAMRLKLMGFDGVIINRSHGWEANVSRSLAPWRRKYEYSEKQSVKKVLGKPMHWVLTNLTTRWSVYWADCTLVSSTHDRDFICSTYKLDNNKISIIPQGVNDAFLNKTSLDTNKRGARNILYVGQFAFIKAPMLIAEVFNILTDENREIEITWCCAESHHAEVRKLLSKEAQSKVTLVGWRSQETLVELYASHAIFVFPSFYEGFGKAFLEAMSCGCVPVCSNTGGMRDIVLHRENGMLSEVGDYQQMTEDILYLLADHNRLRKMSKRAEMDVAHLSWSRFAGELENLYLSLSKTV